MPYQPIENYGIIGNMRTVALVGMNGSIDWYCYPHFDSPSIFGAILDDVKGGRFQISPIGDGVRYKQFYWPSTNILITRFLLADGIAELEDFMPVGLPPDSPWYHLGVGSEAPHLRAHGSDRRRAHCQSSRSHRRHSQLGLPLHMAPRCRLHDLRFSAHRIQRRGGRVHELD